MALFHLLQRKEQLEREIKETEKFLKTTKGSHCFYKLTQAKNDIQKTLENIEKQITADNTKWNEKFNEAHN